ncbi:MAG: hypothetical protein ACLSAP_05705 [Oscillospiraceae bacterium]
MSKNDYALPDGIVEEISAYMRENVPATYGRPRTLTSSAGKSCMIEGPTAPPHCMAKPGMHFAGS